MPMLLSAAPSTNPSLPPRLLPRGWRGHWTTLLLLATLCACQPEAVKPPPEVPAPVKVAEPRYHDDPAEAVNFLAATLQTQLAAKQPALSGTIPVDQFFSEQSAEVAQTGKALQAQLIRSLASALPTPSFAELNTRSVQKAQWVVLPGYAVVKGELAGHPGQWVRLKVIVADVQNGGSLAHAATYLAASRFESAPTPFYKDAPTFQVDRSHADRVAVLAGQARPLSASLQRRASLADAIEAYENSNFVAAEQQFAATLADDPAQLVALSGLYQAQWRQGKKAEAEKSFGQLAAASMADGKLSIKLLFKLASTEFIDEPDLAAQYPLWLRAIVQQVASQKICLDITGHASASGAADYNNKLSLARAQRIVTRMSQSNRRLGALLQAHGKGASETIIGTGSNDATDAIDRRVEFGIKRCPGT